ERSTVSIGTSEDDPILLEGIHAEAGSMVEVFFQYGDETGVDILVPVLDGSLEVYSDLVPDTGRATK
ncbi:MAG: DNA modification methylase, partial [Mycetocola sp.]